MPDIPKDRIFRSNDLQTPFYMTAPLLVALENVGKGICRVTETSARLVYTGLEKSFTLPEHPPYGSAIHQRGRILAPGTMQAVEVQLEKAEWTAPTLKPIYPGIHIVYVFGYVLYEDGRNDLHTTRFGLRYKLTVVDGSDRLILGDGFRHDGPPSYTYAN